MMLSQVRVEQSFILYANCEVIYRGRAASTLSFGNYLITHKNDGTIKIDGGSLCNPLNYQPPGAILNKKGNTLISERKNEIIKINVTNVHFYKELSAWSNNRINIVKTESNLRDYFYDNLSELLTAEIVESYKEFQTPVGNIDILAIDKHNNYYVIEIKRGKANLATCSQLERYSNYFIDIGKNVRDYIVSPDISSNARLYAQENHQIYLQVNHKD